jgi:hypothetical protein
MRFAIYFEVFTFFPLYYLSIFLLNGKGLYKEDRFLALFILLAVTIGIFCVKVFVFPTNEYDYKSIFSTYL